MKPEKKALYLFSIPYDYLKGKEVRYYFTAKVINEMKGSLGSEKKPFKKKSQ